MSQARAVAEIREWTDDPESPLTVPGIYDTDRTLGRSITIPDQREAGEPAKSQRNGIRFQYSVYL